MNNLLRELPSIDALLQAQGGQALEARYGRRLTVEVLRSVLKDIRLHLTSGELVPHDGESVLDAAAVRLHHETRSPLQPVINATGVIIHTNLGRAPLSQDAVAAVSEVARGYSTLEFDLATGKRGSRLLHPERLLVSITGAEAALVVNNNAAALVLLLSALARRRDVLLSRGQSVEIGGGFRVPDIMRQSGARLVEVGTTNRTRGRDYEEAITERTALVMRVHSSNFRQIGFVEETSIAELVRIAHAHGIYAVDDLGSGALLDTADYGLAHEPTVQESVAAGMDLVAFSGDKLLGGPQAGILVGKRALIDQLRHHPLARAVRADKLTLSALLATLMHYRKGSAAEQIPVWQMIARPLADIRREAEAWADAVQGRVREGTSTVGGGSLPGETLPTALLALPVEQPDVLTARLRQGDPPVIARIADGEVLFDPRTVLEGQRDILLARIREVCL